MKKIITLYAILVLLMGSTVFAQAPEKLSYQAVIRNSLNVLVTSQPVGMRISILQASPSGTAVYVETQVPVTNANGLASLEIGAGTVVSGNFAALDWTNGPYFIKTESDPTGGTNYTITGTSQLLSVPYALHANTAGSLTVPVVEVDPIFGASVASGITAADTSYWNSKLDAEVDGSVTNEIQILSISADTLFLSSGGFAVLPAGFDGLYSSLVGAPTNVSSFINDAGYITSPDDADADSTNEIQVLSLSADTLFLSGGGFVVLPAGFDGLYSSLVGAPTNVSSFINDAGYITSPNDADSDPTNEIQNLVLAGNTISITGGDTITIPADSDWQIDSLDMYNLNSGNVGIGTTTPAVKLTVSGGSGATLAGGGYIMTNSFNSTNLVLDNNEIMARNNGAVSALHLQSYGGDFRVHTNVAGNQFVVLDNGDAALGSATPQSKFQVVNGTEATLTSGSGFIQMGPSNTLNILMDDNEIMARNNGAVSPLYVQNDGGDFRVHQNATAGTQFVVLSNGNVGVGTTAPADELVVASGRVEFLGTTDATSTAGTGVLEIGNALRIDGNEIITNTGTTIYINDDNGGDVRMDNGTFFLDASTNRVGLGTTAPANDFHVMGSSTGHVARIENTSTDASADGLAIELSGVDGANNSTNNNYITFYRSGNVVVGRVEGFELDDVNPTAWGICDWVEAGISPDPWSAATAAATLACLDEGITFSSGNGDYAELLERENPETNYDFGMVVGVRGGKISLDTKGAEQIMVISTAPIMLGNVPNNSEEESLYERVAFMGQVPVAVLGAVKSGDYIVASGKNNGLAIAVSPSDLKLEHLTQIVGRSWETKSENFNFVNTVVGVKTYEMVEIFENKLKRLEELEKDMLEVKSILKHLSPEAKLGTE